VPGTFVGAEYREVGVVTWMTASDRGGNLGVSWFDPAVPHAACVYDYWLVAGWPPGKHKSIRQLVDLYAGLACKHF
jgi:hypothetical protein